MSNRELAEKIALEHGMPMAESYDMIYRDFDDMVEVIGYVPDPNYDMDDFLGREILFPKRWLTLGVIPASTEVVL